MEQTYLSFKNKTEYLFKPGSVQHIYPLGSLVFGLLDTDFRVHLADARALLERFRDLDLSEERTFSERLADPQTCVYYQVASFYAAMSQAVLRQSPVLFDLLEDFCLSSYRRMQRETDYYDHALRQIQRGGPNDTSLTPDELYDKLRHSGNFAMACSIMEHFLRTFPEYPDSMKYYIDLGASDRSFCRAALVFLEDIIDALKLLTEAAQDFDLLVHAVLVDENGRPIEESKQESPSSLLAALAQQKDAIYCKYHEMEEEVHIKTQLFCHGKGGALSPVIFFSSDNIAVLIFLELVQLCAENIPVAVCEYCGRYFIPFSKKTKYCDRVADDASGATCKDVAAKLAYAESLRKDRAKELYNKTRNRNQMRCSRAIGNEKMKRDYRNWREKALQALAQYREGQLSWEAYEEIINQPF